MQIETPRSGESSFLKRYYAAKRVLQKGKAAGDERTDYPAHIYYQDKTRPALTGDHPVKSAC